MPSMGEMNFSINELIAISTALDAQIEDCQDFLTSPEFTSAEKNKLMQVLEYSRSAAAKLEKVFADNNIDPEEN